MTCIAAVGDIHLDRDLAGHLRPRLEEAVRNAHLLLVAGDLTRHGTLDEATVVAQRAILERYEREATGLTAAIRKGVNAALTR